MTQTEALKLALEALEANLGTWSAKTKAIPIIREALAQPEQEPVAKVVSTAPERIWLDLGFDPSDEDEISFDDLIDATTWSHDNATGYGIEYVRADTTPPQRKPLTDVTIWNTYKNLWMFHPAEEPRLAGDVLKFARAIEAAHGIKE